MKQIEARLREIGEDNSSGARELADQAAELLFDLLRQQKKVSQEKLIQEVHLTANRLMHVQPSIGPIYNLCNGLLLLLETKNPDFHLIEAGKEWISLFRRRLTKNVEQLRRRALDLLPEKGVVVTYSFSSTVLQTMITAKKMGKSLRVYCSESRPNLEGRRLARELGEAGIFVRFGVDAALFAWMEEADLLLLGSDAVCTRGLLNKVGSAALVLSAKNARKNHPKKGPVKIYALADTEKLIPTPLADRLRISSRDPLEVLESPHPNVEISNRYFEITPLDHFDGIVTEAGVELPEKLIERADHAPVSTRFVPQSKKTAQPGRVFGREFSPEELRSPNPETIKTQEIPSIS